MGFADYFDRNSVALSQALSADNFDVLKPLLEQHTVGIVFDDEGLLSANAEIMIETSVRIVSRLYPNICILYGGTSNEGKALEESMKSLALEINPNITILSNKDQLTASVCIGNFKVKGPFEVYIESDSWNIEVSKNIKIKELDGGTFNPFSAVASACFGAAEVFNKIFEQHLKAVSDDHYIFSLLEYKWSPSICSEMPETFLDDVTFIGLGAVGNAASYTLGFMKNILKGEVRLVDSEKLELSNVQRYISTKRASVDTLKTTIAKYEFDKTGVNTEKYSKTIGNYIAHENRECIFKAIVISVDNPETRIYAQALLPYIVINGWTSDQLEDYGELGISKHWFDSDQACLACLYMPQGKVLSELDRLVDFTGLSKQEIVDIYKTPLDEKILKEISEKKAYKKEILMRWKGRLIREFYVEAGCGGVFLGVQSGMKEHAAIVPITHQSVLAGALVAAELIKTVLGLSSRRDRASHRMSVFRMPYIYDLPKTVKSEKCFCADEDYLLRYKEKY